MTKPLVKSQIELIALAFRRARFTNTTNTTKLNWTAEELATLLQEDNPKFDRQRFLEACGVNQNECKHGVNPKDDTCHACVVYPETECKHDWEYYDGHIGYESEKCKKCGVDVNDLPNEEIKQLKAYIEYVTDYPDTHEVTGNYPVCFNEWVDNDEKEEA